MSERRFRVAILVSGAGSNMEALIRAAAQGLLPRAEIALVLANRPEVPALEKAEAAGVTTSVVNSKTFNDDAVFQATVLNQLQLHRIDIVCLAGYMRKVGPEIVQAFKGRMLNIHPALLPKHGGAGMYGHHVHESVIRAKDLESGCSVHLVDDEFDHGDVLAQARVPVHRDDTPEQLAARVLEQEHQLYPKALAQFCDQLASAGRQR